MKILGIDVGGSGIKGAVVDTKKGVLLTERHRIPTPQPATPNAVIQTITKLIKHFDWHGQVGVGFPAAVVDEVVRTASNIDDAWIGVNAAYKIEKVTGCPTHLVNDVDAAGFAEMKFGAGMKEKGIVLIAAFGTGIGTAIFNKKKLLPNTELGHIRFNGMKAEHYAANSIREKEDLDFETWGKRVNEYLSHLEKLFYPNLIIIGGGISKKFDQFEPYLDLDTPVVPAKNRNHAGIIGAALAAKERTSPQSLAMKNILLFITPTLIWGSTWYVIKFQVGDVDPMFSVSYRFLLAGLIMLILAWFMKLKLNFTWKEHLYILLQGLLIFGINYWLIYMSELYLTSGLVGLVFSLLVFFNIINARIFLKNKLEFKVVLGGALGLLGTALVFWDDLIVFSFEDGKLLGMTLAIGGTLVASLGNITSARNTKAGIPVISCNAFGMTYGGGAMMIIALLSGKELSFIISTEYIASLLYLSVFGSIIAFGAYLTLVGNIGAGKAAYVSLIAPVIALLISTFLEDYQWNVTSLGGAALILTGNTIALYKKKAKT